MVAGPDPETDPFYDVGFEWRTDFVRYYIVINGAELDLFVVTARLPESKSIPMRRSAVLAYGLIVFQPPGCSGARITLTGSDALLNGVIDGSTPGRVERLIADHLHVERIGLQDPLAPPDADAGLGDGPPSCPRANSGSLVPTEATARC